MKRFLLQFCFALQITSTLGGIQKKTKNKKQNKTKQQQQKKNTPTRETQMKSEARGALKSSSNCRCILRVACPPESRATSLFRSLSYFIPKLGNAHSLILIPYLEDQTSLFFRD